MKKRILKTTSLLLSFVLISCTKVDIVDKTGTSEVSTSISESKNNESTNDSTSLSNVSSSDLVKESFNVNFIVSDELINTINVLENENITKPTDPVKKHFTFVGWYKDKDFKELFDFNEPIISNLDLYAKFIENEKYVISFIVDDNTYLEKESYKDELLESPLNPQKDGYTFIGWYIDKELTQSYNFNDAVNSSFKLYAKFDLNKYHVSYIINNNVYANVVVEYGQKVESIIPTLDSGLIFDGWFFDEAFSKPLTDNKTVDDNLVLYGRVKKEEYNVNYYSDGILVHSEKVLYGEKITYKNYSKDGYVFLGWVENIDDDSLFDMNSEVVTSLNLYAKYAKIDDKALSYASYEEGLYTTWYDSSLDNVEVSYAKYNDEELVYNKIDNDLIRINDNIARADVVGLEEGYYVVKVTKSDYTTLVTSPILVSSYDRSGYAHFTTSLDATNVDVSKGIGAYDNNGKLKDGAVVVYVNDKNKNSVTAKIGNTTYTGLANILINQKKSNTPLDIRIIGSINTCQFNNISYESGSDATEKLNNVIGTSSQISEQAILSSNANSYSNDLNKGITKLNGLTSRILYDSSHNEYDSYFNMLDISDAKNVTVEGIGCDATIYQWGFTWSNCSSIEIRNLTFDAYPEDACAFQGGSEGSSINSFKSGHIWEHHNQFNQGKNNWDVCADQDKKEGDGATDLKKLAFVTISYTHYINNHKTGLIGGSNSQKTACVTLHHNYYESCQQRMPLGRQANIHMYNNYYKSSGTNMSLRGSAFGFVENCYFEDVKLPIECQNDSTNGNGVAKVYNCEFINSGTSRGTIVANREDVVENTNLYGTTFDTNKDIFYYDELNKVSNVTLLTTPTKAKEDCIAYAGPHKLGNVNQDVSETTTYKVSYYDNDTLLKEENIESGKNISYVPTKSGYKFLGYYLDKALTNKLTNLKVESDLVIYVSFEKEEEVITTTYELNAKSLYEELGLSKTKQILQDTSYKEIFTLTKNVRIKSDCFSNNKESSYYNSESDYSCVIFIDILEGKNADIVIDISSTESTRIIYLYSVNDLDNPIVSGYINKLTKNDLASGRYFIKFSAGVEPKISSISVTLK